MIDDWNDNRVVLDSLGLLDEKCANKPEPTLEERHDASYDHLTEEEIIGRLKEVKKRLDLLQFVFSKSLSPEISNQIDAWRVRFKEMADVLIDRDPEALYQICRGSEHLLLSSPTPKKSVIPLQAQRMAELTWEIRQEPAPAAPKKTTGDGLDWLLT